ncbi:DLA class II histocompatibility antigen, DR-1 beta chain-like isoform X2 [Alligator mississippiensis]|uniref:DLA class II histocompatibility antigen, DR-1 beta chain-like isoform X2 n=1 Tax=Alligator mississippiensis TaxID=8496 RepID=UPI00287744D5|nr:DLA class II histocompatibility antigen, DR-1 beta chain-like isoform X2 [Alligator mississippiensis]
MGPGGMPGAGRRWAGAVLVTLAVLGPHVARCTEPPEHFLFQGKADCLYTNGTQRVRYLERYVWDRRQDVHFDSDVGVYVADTVWGEPETKSWNSQKDVLEDARGAVDTFCRYNYGVFERGHVIGRSVKPKVKVSPTKSGAQVHPDTLICSVTGFYPGGIEVKWLKNGQEQTAGVVSTELMQNGDWTFQILVMLEMTPRSGDVYTCQVEHSSLPDPVTVLWEAQSDSARSKMLTGVGGFVLGLIFLALGLLIYLRNKKGRPVPQPTGLLS